MQVQPGLDSQRDALAHRLWSVAASPPRAGVGPHSAHDRALVLRCIRSLLPTQTILRCLSHPRLGPNPMQPSAQQPRPAHRWDCRLAGGGNPQQHAVMSPHETILRAYNQVAHEYAARFWNEFEHKPFDRMLLGWYASQIPPGETVLELGAGPGEVSGYLSAHGAHCLATDLSPRMLEHAKKLFPALECAVEDFFHLSFADASFCAAIAYYAVVNFPLGALEPAFREMRRVLKPEGCLLFTFHIYEGEERILIRRFLEQDLEEIPFYFFKVDEMRAMVEKTGFRVVDILMRYPYPQVEYASKRAFFLLRNA